MKKYLFIVVIIIFHISCESRKEKTDHMTTEEQIEREKDMVYTYYTIIKDSEFSRDSTRIIDELKLKYYNHKNKKHIELFGEPDSLVEFLKWADSIVKYVTWIDDDEGEHIEVIRQYTDSISISIYEEHINNLDSLELINNN